MAVTPKDVGHDDGGPKAPTNPKMAPLFDQLVAATLELVTSVKQQNAAIATWTEEVRELTLEVRSLIRALAPVVAQPPENG